MQRERSKRPVGCLFLLPAAGGCSPGDGRTGSCRDGPRHQPRHCPPCPPLPDREVTFKMLPLPEALTHPKAGYIFWSQWANLPFVKCAATELKSISNTSFSLSWHLKTSYLAMGEKKKCTLHISSAYSPCECQLVSADGYHKDKKRPLNPE